VAITGIQEELEQYRRLMEVPPPEEFEEGFSIRTILGALFVAFVMLPGAAYLGLVAGISGQLSSAAQWVTVILFVEVARRSFIVLKRQEIYLLVILATAILGTNPYTNPHKNPPKSVKIATGVAGSTDSVFKVKSMKGMGISCSGRVMIAPVMVGMPA